ncbi:MAG TPA: NAD(P)H-dependent oxidoreductase subunit E [Terriglobales bacterium]|jgi:NADH-quinone oxidoreductase subunit E|nr:NAD(P)H-dependent oxidoreductase subunit E [Terriglobales bacterium]
MPQVDMEKVEPLLEQYEDQRLNLIPILQDVQETYRYLPELVLRRISKKLRVPLTDVYQVATFYRCFSLVPRGKHVIQVCLGTACHVRGAPRVLDRILRDLKMAHPGTSDDLQFTVETVRCIGCCGLAPVARVDNSNTHPHLTQAKVAGLLRKYQEKAEAPKAAKPDEASHAKA